MASLVTIAQVRVKSGAPIALMSDVDVQSTIDEVQEEALNYFNINIEPTKKVEIRDGNGKNQIYIKNPYIWKLLEFTTRINQSGVNSIDIEDTTIDPISSIIKINSFERYYYVLYKYPNSVRLKYLSAFMGKTNVITESTDDVDVGTSVDIAVLDETIFAVNDWVLIEGLDGKREAAQITATDTDKITVDQLVQSHEDGSIITKLQTDESLVQYVLYAASVAVAINAIGGTYTLATGYTYPEYTVQIGIPYTHWKSSLDANEKRRIEAKNKIHSKLNAIS